MNCRFCHSNELELFLDMGYTPLANRFLSYEELKKPQIYYPLQVYLCKSCKLSQLGYVPQPEEVYNENYAYEAGVTKLRRQHHFEMAKSIVSRFDIPKNSLIIDIGSNVGMLLEGFKNHGMTVLGVDASDNVADIARQKGIETITGFFGMNISQSIIESKKNKADIVTATNVFAHLNDYDDFLNGIKNVLKEDGVFIFQVHYFLDLVKKLQYDMIFHEHILFESLRPLNSLFQRFDMEIFDVERHSIDGGTIRCFVCRKGKKRVSDKINELLKLEEDAGIHSSSGLLEFANKVKEHREKLIDLLTNLKRKGKKIIALSMPAKGIALLNYCKIDNRLLDYATEKSELKIGKFAPGNYLEIKSDNELIKDKPDYALILAWNFEKEIVENNKEFLDKGGKFIVPIPEPKVIEKNVS